MKSGTVRWTSETVGALLAAAALACAGCSGPSPAVDADAGRDAGRDAGPPPPLPGPPRGACPEGYEPGCVAGFALCGEGRTCPEGQTCEFGLCVLETDEPIESCWMLNDDELRSMFDTPGCPSGRLCLTSDTSRHGLCVPAAVCETPPGGYSCRFYDGSLYDDSAWSGECPPSFPDYPYCGGVCGEDACPRDLAGSHLVAQLGVDPANLLYRHVSKVCVGTTASRPFGVCAGSLWGLVSLTHYESFFLDQGITDAGPFAVLEFDELPGEYFVVPLAVCLDYPTRVEGVRCLDTNGDPV